MKLKVTNPIYERQLIHDDFRQALLATIKDLQKWEEHSFEGVCFILDEADYIVNQNWANDAWSYLRGLKDTDMTLKPFFGFVLSGYRDLKEYQQRSGSPLFNIAKVEWLTCLTDAEMRQLVEQRCREEQVSLLDDEIIAIAEWAGTHPYLVQQALNTIFDNQQQQKPRPPIKLFTGLLQQHNYDFSNWWRAGQSTDGLVEMEQLVYRKFILNREYTAESIVETTNLPIGKVIDALQFLVGIGVVRQLDEERYELGARLFKEWVLQLPRV